MNCLFLYILWFLIIIQSLSFHLFFFNHFHIFNNILFVYFFFLLFLLQLFTLFFNKRVVKKIVCLTIKIIFVSMRRFTDSSIFNIFIAFFFLWKFIMELELFSYWIVTHCIFGNLISFVFFDFFIFYFGLFLKNWRVDWKYLFD